LLGTNTIARNVNHAGTGERSADFGGASADCPISDFTHPKQLPVTLPEI
jgi:hypothetical protein